MAAHQIPPSLGFSRQEHWSGLPFLSPMQESEKWKWSRSVVSDPQRPHGLQPTRLLRPWDSPGKSTGVGCHCLLRIKMLQGKKKKRKTLGYSPEPYGIWKEVKFSLFKQNACPSLLLLTSISGETAWGKFLPVLSPCTSDYSTTVQT